MTTYFVELGFCFQPRPTAFTLENDACQSLDQATENNQVLAPWTDGTWWVDFDGTLVGWVEIDGVTLFPPLEFYPVAGVTPPVVVPPVQTPMVVAIRTGGMTMRLTAGVPTRGTVALTASAPVSAMDAAAGLTFNGAPLTFNGAPLTYTPG